MGVFGRLLRGDGSFASGEFGVNTYTNLNQHLPRTACSPAGQFMVVWASDQQDGSGEGVYGVSWPLPAAPVIFSDGFESGDPSLWSSSVP